MAVKKEERGKVVQKCVNGTIFDVRHVPRYIGHGKARRMESSSYHLYIGKKSLKGGFKSVEAAGQFAAENLNKYNRKAKSFE